MVTYQYQEARIDQWSVKVAKYVQLFPANGEQWPAAWTNNKQGNEDQIHADKVKKAEWSHYPDEI